MVLTRTVVVDVGAALVAVVTPDVERRVERTVVVGDEPVADDVAEGGGGLVVGVDVLAGDDGLVVVEATDPVVAGTVPNVSFAGDV